MKNKIFNGFEIVQDLIKLRWIPEILKSMEDGNRRYTDILDSIEYMSHTELNRKLALLLDKKVIRKVGEDDGDYYELEEFGEDLIHIFYHLEELEEKYFSA